MGGEVNVYEVRQYRAKYIDEVEPIVEALIEDMSVGKIGLILEAQFPAEIEVGRGFYKSAARFIVDSDSKLRAKAKSFRSKTRSDLLANTWIQQGDVISKKVSMARKVWWEQNPEAKEYYSRLAIERLSENSTNFGHNGLPKIEAHGRIFDSLNELLTYEILSELGFEEVRDHVRTGTKTIDFYIEDIGLWLEIDGMARPKAHFENRLDSSKRLAVVSVKPNANYQEKVKELYDGITEAVKDQSNSIKSPGTYFYGFDGGKRP